ncbi:MAG TPA: lysylphosphatidylglycerol synthase domain-containing protein [Roseateles sp.]|nr:lysylphosphatidylglycerol synthase domain-containing protein [Roseateles sp.]
MRSLPALPAAATARPAWQRWLGTAFMLAVLALLAWAARKVAWGEVWTALRDLPPAVLAGAALLAALSHLIYSSYDLIGRACTGHRVPRPRVMRITFISYAFNLNLGALVGAFALRLRLYAREGLEQAQIAQVLGLSLATNWLGYGLLAGGLLLLRPVTPPAGWALGSSLLQGLGALLWLLVGGYLVLCGWARRRSFSLGGHQFGLPDLPMALLQLALSCLNWLTIAAVIFVLLQGSAPYAQVLAVLLAAAVAGVLTHVPAGLGVLEAVFLALLGAQLPQAGLLAALLAYRAFYYLAPLMLASLLYFLLEAQGKARAP